MKIVVGISGASGSIYAKVFLDMLLQAKDQIEEVALVFSKNAKMVWEHELENDAYKNYPFKVYEAMDFMAPFASGSAKFEHMVIIPCSMGTMGRIAHGLSNDLMSRAADVILKEKRQLILCIRDTPYNLIHIKNMELLSLAGATIMPASPSFYSMPKNFEDLAKTVCARVIDQLGINLDAYRWGE